MRVEQPRFVRRYGTTTQNSFLDKSCRATSAKEYSRNRQDRMSEPLVILVSLSGLTVNEQIALEKAEAASEICLQLSTESASFLLVGSFLYKVLDISSLGRVIRAADSCLANMDTAKTGVLQLSGN